MRLIDSITFGKSDGNYSLEQAVKELESQVVKDDEKDKIICGLSLGAAIAAQHALTYPDTEIKYIFSSFHPSPPKTVMAIQTVVFSLFWRIIQSKMEVNIEKKQFLSILKSVKDRDFSADLPQLKQKSLFIAGEKDGLHVRAAQYFEKKIPDNEIKIIENAGHEINKDKPKKLAKTISEFIT